MSVSSWRQAQPQGIGSGRPPAGHSRQRALFPVMPVSTERAGVAACALAGQQHAPLVLGQGVQHSGGDHDPGRTAGDGVGVRGAVRDYHCLAAAGQVHHLTLRRAAGRAEQSPQRLLVLAASQTRTGPAPPGGEPLHQRDVVGLPVGRGVGEHPG